MRTTIIGRLSSLGHLMRPLALTFVGIVLLSLGVAYLFKQLYHILPLPFFFFYLTLQFLPIWVRGALFLLIGLLVLGYGVWQLSGVVVIPLNSQVDQRELVLGYRRPELHPKIVVLSGGAGMFMMASMGKQVEHLTCITPIQDPVEYYYRASSLFTAEYVEYLPPTPVPAQVIAELNDGTQVDLKQIREVVRNPLLSGQHVARLTLHWPDTSNDASGKPMQPPALSRPVLDAIAEADALVLGPGSLFESILPDLLIDELRAAIQRSRMRTIYVCNLMTEPGLTSGFSVADHIRAIKRYGGFTPDYVLVNAERIEPEVRRMYEAAKQVPVYLEPEAYEETAVLASEHGRQTGILVEGAVVLEADLASDLFQSTASINAPTESRAVRVLRHDPDKLAAAIMALLKRET